MKRLTRGGLWVLLTLAVIFGPGAVQWLRLSWRERALDRRLRELEATDRRLTDQQQRLASDPVYVEGLIRSTFKVSKPGELVVRVESDSSHP